MIVRPFFYNFASFRCLKRRLWGVRFRWKAMLYTKMSFCENSCFASTRTQIPRFWKTGSHAKIVQNLMQNGTWQLTMSKTRKAKLWSRNFVLQGVFGTTPDAQGGAHSMSKRHPSSLINESAEALGASRRVEVGAEHQIYRNQVKPFRIAVLVVPARPTDGRSDSVICNPNAFLGTYFPI